MGGETIEVVADEVGVHIIFVANDLIKGRLEDSNVDICQAADFLSGLTPQLNQVSDVGDQLLDVFK